MSESKKLFELGNFELHSGEVSKWKIECDALTEGDYKTCAYIVAEEWKLIYNGVKSIGGENSHIFAEKLREYQQNWAIGVNTLLIVDDVLTTGKSMQETYDIWKSAKNIKQIGVVIFARGKCQKWIRPIFQYNG
jgi:orotate phosphoribosyltransferase